MPPPQKKTAAELQKEMQQKLMRQLHEQSFNGNDQQDSELEASSDFYEGLKQKMNLQLSNMRISTTQQSTILKELKTNIGKQMNELQQFEEEVKELKHITTVEQNIIANEKIEEIKTKLKEQIEEGHNVSKIVLADEKVNENRQLEEEKESNIGKRGEGKGGKQNEKEKQKRLKELEKQQKLQKKIQQANLERERVNMEREDELSMKYEQQVLSNFFNQRFLVFKMPKVIQKSQGVGLKALLSVTKPKATFTNLRPLTNNENNVLPRNAPELALKSLKKNRKGNMLPISNTKIKIQFKRKVANPETMNEGFEGQIKKNNDKPSQHVEDSNTKDHAIYNGKPESSSSSNLSNLLSTYVKQIQDPLKTLQSISLSYKPKFLHSHLDESQKVSNIDISQLQDGSNKPLSLVLANNDSQQQESNNLYNFGFEEDNKPSTKVTNCAPSSSCPTKKQIKQFKLTFQNITDVSGIDRYNAIELAALQHNMIKNIQNLGLCEKLIQLNLSNNRIVDMKSIKDLKWLRYLNLTQNRITEVMFMGGSLEMLYLKSNRVQEVLELNRNVNLKVIDLSFNNLHEIGEGIDRLYFLQELNLHKNCISSLTGHWENLLLLQKLDLSHNRLQVLSFGQKVEKQSNSNVNPKDSTSAFTFTYFFLNTLNLSYNKLSTLPPLCLPSLEKLYITNNKITGESLNKQIMYLPELKVFNIDENQLKGFSAVWSFVKYSKKLEMLKYDDNEYFLSLRVKVREVYEAIVYRNMRNLKILNENPMDKGVKAYYESVYSSYLAKKNPNKNPQGNTSTSLYSIPDNIKIIQEYISFLLKSNRTILQLQEEFNPIRNKLFTETDIFIKCKSISKVLNLKQIVSNINTLSKNGCRNQSKGTTNQALMKQSSFSSSNMKTLLLQPSIYYYHDRFQHRILQSVHKIKSLYVRWKYHKLKRQKYFLKQKEKLQNLLPSMENDITKIYIQKVISKFTLALKSLNEDKAAILIQKVWRGYKVRKLFKKMMSRLKAKEDDGFSDLQEADFDSDIFEDHEFPEFNFDMPQDVNFEDLIIEPKYFELAEAQEKKRLSKGNNNKKGLKGVIEEQQQEDLSSNKPMMNNFMGETSKSKKNPKKESSERTEEQKERLMKEWGFENPASLEALGWRKKRKEEMKRKEAEKNMTAAQRYERFKKYHK